MVVWSEAAGSWVHDGGPSIPIPHLGYDLQYAEPTTELIDLRARFDDPATGQFLRADSLYAITGERSGDAGNDPETGSDLTGLIWFSTSCLKGDLGPAAHTATNYVVKPAATFDHKHSEAPGSAGRTTDPELSRYAGGFAEGLSGLQSVGYGFAGTFCDGDK